MRKFILLIAIGVGLYQYFNKQDATVSEPIYYDDVGISAYQTSTSTSASVVASTQFSCQGKTHCSQMGSYEEAKFYLDNCPGMKMDGDGDGIPCEQQFSSW